MATSSSNNSKDIEIDISSLVGVQLGSKRFNVKDEYRKRSEDIKNIPFSNLEMFYKDYRKWKSVAPGSYLCLSNKFRIYFPRKGENLGDEGYEKRGAISKKKAQAVLSYYAGYVMDEEQEKKCINAFCHRLLSSSRTDSNRKLYWTLNAASEYMYEADPAMCLAATAFKFCSGRFANGISNEKDLCKLDTLSRRNSEEDWEKAIAKYDDDAGRFYQEYVVTFSGSGKRLMGRYC